MDRRDVHPRVVQQARHFEVGSDVFLRGRRIHDDPTASIRQNGTEIPPKAGICRGDLDTRNPEVEVLCDPTRQKFETGVRQEL